MTEETEVLDWGHEEEDGVAAHGSDKRAFSMDDAEDAVSLGGDEEDEFLTYQSRVPQDVYRGHSPPKSARQSRRDPSRGHGDSPFPHHSQEQHTELTGSSDQSPLPGRAHTLGALVHALPPKPVVSSVPFVHPSHPSIIEATAMASRGDRDKRNGAVSKPNVYDHDDSLPHGWEVKYPRNGRGVYYYNIHTQESTWTRPTAPTITREKRSERLDRRDDSHDKYGDRYYRPGETGRREERPVPSAQLIDSYVPDSYTPNQRNSRPSPPPPRAREREPTPSPRRPQSPDASHGERESAHREAPSAALSARDRVWVARDTAPHERQREHRQPDDPPPSETEHRNLPRVTERSSTLRPRSPASYARGSQESTNTIPHASAKPTHPVSEAPPSGRKSRFAQADDPVQHRRRQSDSRDLDMRRTRTDDVSYSARYVDDLPSSRSMPYVRRDDDTPTHPASDAQRLGTRKRSPLPLQDVSRSGAGPAPARRDGNLSRPASPVPAPVAENRHTSRVISDDTLRDSARRSPSPPSSQPGPPDRGDRDRGRSRWSKPHGSGPSQADPHIAHESSRSRVHDVAMDVDHASPLRSSDPPTKHIPPRRLALQDEVPRYPRAMLNSENDGPSRGTREARDGVDSRYRSAVDDSSRFGSRDRLGMDRHPVDQTISQKEPIRSVETRPPTSGSNIKLSGTNNIPIGGRNKFAGNPPPPPVPPNSRRAPATPSGSNGEPVAPRRDRISKEYERPPHLDDTTVGRGTPTEPAKREEVRRSPSNNPRALPQAEPGPLPTRPSRATLGISRFGPPLAKENIEPERLHTTVSSESLPSDQPPEGSSRATPPPPSRESSMGSFKDTAAVSIRPPHLPARPASPPREYRYRSGDPNKSYHRPNAQSPVTRDHQNNEIIAEAPARPRPSSPAPRKRTMDSYPSDPPPPPARRDNRDVYNSERLRTNFRDPQVDHLALLPPPPPVQDEDRERAPPPMHPERALMLQANGLPPRPPSALGRARSGRGPKRDRRDDRDEDRAEPLRGRRGSASPGNGRRHPEDDRPGGYGGGGGTSLLDRLTLDEGSHVNSSSLRDRVQLPSKRDREEMLADEFTYEVEGDDYDGSKRMRRRGTKMRKGRHEG